MRHWISLFLLSSLLTCLYSPASATTFHHGKAQTTYRKPAQRKTPPKVQSHYSFIPPKLPSETLQRLQAPLQGRVVQVQVNPELTTSTSPATPISVTLPVPTRLENPVSKGLGFGEPRKNRIRSSHSLSERITPQNSWIVELPDSDIASLSEIVAQWIQTQIVSSQATLVLADPPSIQLKSHFIPSLAYALQKRGYAIAGKDASKPDAYWVRYRIRAFDQGLLVQIKINGQETSRLYARSQTGALIAASPITRMGGQP
jgi:hypothetical protein